MSSEFVIDVRGVSHRYGDRLALNNLSFSVAKSQIFGLLGPNGGGKTTLFRILSTLFPVQSGQIEIQKMDLAGHLAETRRCLGVVFQSPSLDKKLTVRENLWHQGHLYGLKGEELKERIDLLLGKLRLTDRANDWVEKLSGGLQRRVEVAKGLLHRPSILLLDEPSTGLDPGARIDLWTYLRELRDKEGVTILVTTHLMEEAEKCDQLMLINKGEKVAYGTPSELKASLGGNLVTITAENPEALKNEIEQKLSVQVSIVQETLRIEAGANTHDSQRLMGNLIENFGSQIQSITLAQPTLEDVFIRMTGHRFFEMEEAPQLVTKH